MGKIKHPQAIYILLEVVMDVSCKEILVQLNGHELLALAPSFRNFPLILFNITKLCCYNAPLDIVVAKIQNIHLFKISQARGSPTPNLQ